ncbi:hypothetical protein BDZ94DRAFT_636599 [Collybia nuda]|uniref:SCD domain-containing protein n=1 Tax=Collybia nuda TaxID=64659 RepID=A0A9P5Y4A9_9AGAR|nr:hypothetical protein BDZ94DRAFT_636599 [Collybia nuda]
MSENPVDSPAPRRSQRERRPAKIFTPVATKSTKGKRKRQDSDDEIDVPPEAETDDAQHEDGDEADEEEDFRAPKPKRKARPASTPKAKGSPPTKKTRVTKMPGSKPAKPAVKRGRKAKVGEDAYDAVQVAKDTKITADNPLFNAIMNPSAALQSTAEDFLESLGQSPGAAQAELINLILRSCGCNDSVNSDEVLDYDGVVDALDNFTEGLKQDDSPVYPLTSKLPVFKKFRKSLSEFIERLIASSADLGALYSSDLMATLQTWVIAMSSSQIRSFRHTTTVLALEVETALCDVAASVEKEAEVVGRQREGEKKRKASNKGAGAREKELQIKAHEIRGRRDKLAEFLKEFVDGVFVHRYRDLDPNIRAECVRAIGQWFKKYPAHFLDAAYLRYVGWVLSDTTTQVRLEAVKSLSAVYEQADYIGSLNHFTERFKPRLIEMATGDIELSVRVAVIQVLGALDGHSLLEDEEREKLCLLVFDEEAKVRKAVSRFVKGVWEECLDERLVGKNKPTEEDRQRAGVKALALLLVKWGKALDKLGDEVEDSENGDIPEVGGGGVRTNSRRKEVPALVAMEQKSRTALAVEAFWEEVDPVRDWEGLLDVLLMDHSAAGDMDDNEGSSRGVRARPNGHTSNQDAVDEAWRLEEIEEGVLLEALVATLRRTKAEAGGGKKGEDETVVNDITRELIKGLPRLFLKHQTDQNRIADVLLIPPLMNLDLYLEMRMITGYASLWDDVTKQFLSHSSLNVLSHAMAAIRHFMDATSLSNTNSTKILELEDELSSALRDAVAGRDEIEVASFTEDEVLSLGALCTRLTVLSGTRNMTTWIEEDEGGKQSSAWDIINALIERGRLGYKEEETMIEQALHTLTLHIIWKGKELTSDGDPSPEEIRHKQTLVSQREVLLEKLIEYAVGTQNNTVDGVKRTAFKNLLDLHVLFSPAQPADPNSVALPTASVSICLDDEVQYRCAGYIQAEIERYAESFDAGDAEDDDEVLDSDGEPMSDGEPTEDQNKKPRSGKGKRSFKEVNTNSRTQLEQEYLFIDVISTFLRAIRAGALHIRHSAVLLAYYGQLGSSFDMCSKIAVDVLREEGMIHDRGEVVVDVLINALREAYTLVLDGVVRDDQNTLHLAKLLATCFVIRGSQLSIVRRLDSQHVVQVHLDLLSWITKRLAVYENNKNKKSLKLGIAFFRVLVPLVSMIQSRDALKIKAHMDQVLAQAKLEVSPTSKAWEPQRMYEKRLTTVMSKDKPATTKKRGGKAAKNTDAISGDEDTSDGEALAGERENRDSPPRRRSARTRGDRTVAIDLEPTEDEPELEPTTPKSRPRPRATYKKRLSKEPSPPRSPERQSQRANSITLDGEGEPNGLDTPKVSRKRGRSEDDDEDIVNEGANEEADPGADSFESTLTPPGDIEIRRKRVRH